MTINTDKYTFKWLNSPTLVALTTITSDAKWPDKLCSSTNVIDRYAARAAGL